MKKRMLSALLCLCLVLALLPVSALAANPVYLALGDSITTGYKPDNTKPDAKVDSPFANQIANDLDYYLTNLAANGETTTSLLEKLNNPASDISTALPNASLITITIGGNDMMDALYAYLLNAYNDENPSSTITLDELKAKLLNGGSEILVLASKSISEFFVSTDAQKAFSDFGSNLSGILSKIQEVNPHAAIYIATQYNPYSKLAKDWGTFVEQIETINTQFVAGVQSLNTIINNVAANKATVVDVYAAFEEAVTDGKTVCNPELEITSYFPLEYQLTLDFHPNQAGHDLIADTFEASILAATPAEGHKVLNGSGEQVGELYATLAEAFDAAKNNGYTVEMGKDETLAAAIPAGVTLRVPSGITLTVPKTADGLGYLAQGTLEFVAGATFKLGDDTLVGTKDNDSSLVLSSGSATMQEMTVTLKRNSVAEIPSGKTLYLMLGTNGPALNAVIEAGAKLTVYGTLKAVSGTPATGSRVTINGTLDVNNGDMTVALKANVTKNGGTFSITGAGSVYSQVDLTDAITTGEESKDSLTYQDVEYAYKWVAPQPKSQITVGGVPLSGSSTVPAYATTNSDGKVITTDANKDNYNIEWDGRYLTLRNAKIVYDGDAAIVTNGDLELYLIGDNYVSGEVYGFNLGDKALDIYGDDAASLVITGGTAVGSAYVTRVNPVNQLVAVQGDDIHGAINDIGGSPFDKTKELNHEIYYYFSIRFLDRNGTYITPSSAQYDPYDTLSYAVYPYDSSDDVTEVKIDDDTLTSDDYTYYTSFYNNKVTIILENAYLDTLSADTHTVTITLNDNETVSAQLVIPETYTLTVNILPAGSGSCRFDARSYGDEKDGSVTYRVVQGNAVSLWASADYGYHFQAWRDASWKIISADEEYSFTPTGDTTLNLVFGLNTYELTARPSKLDFGSRQEGYSQVPTQEVVLTNNSDVPIAVFAPEMDAYVTSIPEDGLIIFTGESETVSVRPVTGLKVGNYDTTLVFDGYDLNNTPVEPEPMALTLSARTPYWEPKPNTQVMVDLDFTVTRDSGSTRNYYYLTFDTNGGEELGTVRVPARSTVNLTKYVTTRSGCEFAGWFDDQWLTDDITSIYMDGNKTVYAGWDPFWDVDAYDWFYNAVLYTFAEDLMEGTGAHTFNPSANVTRGMLVTILYRLEGEPTVSGSAAFSDVSRNAYYTKAVNWAASEDIVKGFTDGTFRPNDPVTREQMATIFFRYADYCGYDTDARADLSGYRDAVDISSWALAAVRWANAEGLVQGITTKTLVPQGLATRAQISTILVRFCRDIVE